MISNFFNVLSNFSFEGRASRKEYWSFMLIYFLVAVAFGALFAMLGMADSNIPKFILIAGAFIQGIALGVRRLHDIDKTGWFTLVSVIPFVGGLVFFVLMLLPGTQGPNNYGADPYGNNATTVVGKKDAGGWKKVS